MNRPTIELKQDEILVLRNCHTDGSAYNGFVYPKSGIVECPDWQDIDQCGNGLHGLPWGVGSTGYFYGDDDAVWLVIRVSAIKGNYRHGSGDLIDKCKFNRGTVEHYGTREDAISLISEYLPYGLALNYATQKAGDYSTQTAGDRSTQKAGDRSTQKAGKNSVQATMWWDSGQWFTACRSVTPELADKWYFVSNGVWRECTEKEIVAAEARCKK